MIIKNGNVITPCGILENTDIRILDDKIIEISKDIHTSDEIFDAKGLFVSPGLVDIHTHGGFGCDFMDDDEDSLYKALSFHAKNGTTSVLTSSVTAPVDKIVSMVNRVREYMKKDDFICRVLGAHIEGPYISYKNKGAQKAEYLRIPSMDDYSFILDNHDVIKNVTIASELDGAAKMAKELVAAGIVVSSGHDDGTKDSIYRLIEAGLTNCTHWYCAMSTARILDTTRTTGLMEIGLIDDRLTLELLADNHHLPPELVKMAYYAKGPDKLCIVSDSLRAAGMPADGAVYTLGASDDEDTTKFVVSDGVARLLDGSRFAGSIQPLGQMIRNLVFDCDIPLIDAVKMASETPAKIIGVYDEIGSIEISKKADIYIMDENLCPVKTIVNGKMI